MRGYGALIQRFTDSILYTSEYKAAEYQAAGMARIMTLNVSNNK